MCYLQKGAQLNVSVADRDLEQGEFDDLIDHFTIPINIPAGSSMANNFTGRYNYVQLEFTIEVRCIGVAENTDENCVCLPGFTGLLCEDNIDDCIGVTCSDRGRCVDEDSGYRCECFPGFIGQLCEVNIDDCIGVTCSNNRGKCVDGVQNFSCNCDPGYTGAICETGQGDIRANNCLQSSTLFFVLATLYVKGIVIVLPFIYNAEVISNSSPVLVAAISGGVVSGLVISFLIVILIILLLIFMQKIRGSSVQGMHSNELRSSHI